MSSWVPGSSCGRPGMTAKVSNNIQRHRVFRGREGRIQPFQILQVELDLQGVGVGLDVFDGSGLGDGDDAVVAQDGGQRHLGRAGR